MRSVHDLATQAALCVEATLKLAALREPEAHATAEEVEAAAWDATFRARTLRSHLEGVHLAGTPEQVAADGKRLAQAIKAEAYPFESPLHGVRAEVRTIGYLRVHDRHGNVLAELVWQEADPKARKATCVGAWAVEAGDKHYHVTTLPDLLTILRVLQIQARR